MSAKHTPGPWVASEANAYGESAITAGDWNIASVAGGIDGSLENAGLIAAAPELFPLAVIAADHLRREYLKLAERYAGTPWEKDMAYIKAKEASINADSIIAKATGSGS